MTEPASIPFDPVSSLQIVPDGDAFALALDGYVLVDSLPLEKATSIQSDYETRGAAAIMDSFEDPPICPICKEMGINTTCFH